MKLKKLFSVILCAVLVLPCFLMVGCGKDPDTNSRMTVDLNPSVEFMLDKNNKVVSVTALNDDGSVIIYGETFIGLTAEEAAEKFTEIAKQTGYLQANGTVTDNEIKISITGNTDLYNSVKSKVNAYLSEENILANITKVNALTKDEIAELVEASGVAESLEELKKMSQEKLLEKLSTERKELPQQEGTTAQNILSPALQEAYNSLKTYKLNLAENEAIKTAIASVDSLTAGLFQMALSALTGVETYFNSVVTSAVNTAYQNAAEAVLQAKENLITKRAELEQSGIPQTEIDAQLASFETALTEAETALNNLKPAIETAIATAKSQLNIAKQTIDELINSYSSEIKNAINDNLTTIQNSVNDAKDQALTDFETQYSAQIEAYNTYIATMKQNLKDAVAGNAQ